MTSINIIDLSRGGVRLTAPDATLEVGERYRITFRLDDTLRTEIRENIVIRIVHSDGIFGAEFLQLHCVQELDFYLKSWAVKM